ncbi:MAG: hypothetical protein B7Y36_12960 [Novosphingobium sp. 28-62-57]|uniref:hypothetical protein n=1 Tax=unclassified Novosphingobium TaxID=2644732 RepID=UPI000BC95578|nr:MULTISPECIES: hypothetical protein [unclassified Novosphingobium]OYW48339.1 MAG: hypothetical protein B7Z34_14335 [Novosphingobium sp. 12-62-10]OYZ09594.1 MAG: hypothetical protein B7Y36_12960 [Novosphingobium sp. 28-62-57]
MLDHDATPGHTPAHLWAVGVVSLLWNSFGCVDYTMSKLDPVAYMQSVGMGEAEIAYTQALPAWLSAFWALGVWGSLAGSVLLLLRSRHAVTAFAVSLLGLAVTQIYNLFDSTVPESMNLGAMLVMNLVIWASLLFLLWYALRMKGRGVLR